MAYPEGFEPPTSWSVARHSIQLSYGRKQTAMKFARGTLQNHNANTPADHSFSRGEFCVGVGGQGDPTEAYIRTPRGGIDRSPDAALRKIRPRKVPTTGLEPVRRFRHWSLKPACLPIPARGHQLDQPANLERSSGCSRRDSNPHGVNPHRVLNPARLPIPPPER